MIKVKVKNSQAVESALKNALLKYKDAPSVTVGIHEDTGNHPDAGMTNAKLGAILNYGIPGKIPPRPWLIPGYKQGEKRYTKDLKHSIESGLNLPTAMLRIGSLATGEVQKYMTDLRVPPNAPLTIALKGSDNPLIDTGLLRSSITYKLTYSTLKEGGLT